MIKKTKRSEKAALSSSVRFWTAFAAGFAFLIYRTAKTMWQIKGIGIAYLIINVALFFVWVYLRRIAPRKRFVANRNDERLFGAWIAFAVLTCFFLWKLQVRGLLDILLAMFLALLITALLLFFLVRQETKLLVSTLEIVTPKIARDRIRIVQITDLHAGLWSGLTRLEEVVEEINEHQPDIIVSTGDLKDERLGADCGEELTVLSKLNATIGKYAVSGNHDYANIAEAIDFTEQSGFKVLNGTAIETEGLIIAGAGDRDHYEKQQWGLTRSELLVLAYEFIQKESFLILLRHRGIIEDGQKTHFDLQLSGYKDGMRLLHLALRKCGFAPGKGKFKKIPGGGLLYHADGAGYIGVPARIFCKPEVVVIDLIKEKTEDAPTE